MFKLPKDSRRRLARARNNPRNFSLRVESLEKRLTMDGHGLGCAQHGSCRPGRQCLTKVTVNQPFDLRIIAEDLRADPQGIFAAWDGCDLSPPPWSRPAVHSRLNIRSSMPPAERLAMGSLTKWLFSNSLVPVGGGLRYWVASRFVATDVAPSLFAINPADDLPFH